MADGLKDLYVSLVAYLKAELAAEVGTRVYSGLAPQGESVFPRIVLSHIGDDEELSHSGGVTPEFQVQFSIQGKSLEPIYEIRDALRALLHGYKGLMGTVTIGHCELYGSYQSFDDELGVFVLPVDYAITINP